MNEIRIDENISYIPATEDPLSADIGIVRADGRVWLFDAGADERAIEGLTGEYDIVLSHFHRDHIGNLGRLNIRQAYVSRETARHTGFGQIVDKDIFLGSLHIFPLPSSHCKGCLGLEVGERYAFTGDALYGRFRDGCRVFNVTLLKDQIETLKRLRAPSLLLSHYPGLIRPREEVIREQEAIYGQREKGAAEIRLPAE